MQYTFSGPRSLGPAIAKKKPRRLSRSKAIAVVVCEHYGVAMKNEPAIYPPVRAK